MPHDIDYLLEEVVTLPSLPATVARITEMVQDPDCSLAAVGKVISADPAIAMKTLRLVNSAYYALQQDVRSVEHAVTLLGIKVVKNMVLSAAVFDSLKQSVTGLLEHSVACGAAMRALVEKGVQSDRFESADQAFIYGLLHDVGKIIFEQFMPDELAQVDAAVQNGEKASYEAEKEIIGVGHGEMGARLAMKWKLPDELVSAIAGHHDLAQCTEDGTQNLAALLCVADYIVSVSGMPSNPKARVKTSDEAWEASGLTSQDVPSVMCAYFDGLAAAQDLIRLAA